jgi:hypothetical protein
MLKTAAFSLLTVLLGTASIAYAGTCNGSHCTVSEPGCCAPPAAPAHEHAATNVPTAKAPQSTRSYSYQPSRSYSTPTRRAARPGRSSGIRGADAKILGSY